MRWRLCGPAAGLSRSQPGRKPPSRVSSWERVRRRRLAVASLDFIGPSRLAQAGKNGVWLEWRIERYIYRSIDSRARLFGMKAKPVSLEKEYARLRTRLARLGWISQGYAQDRGPGAGGPCYQWTRKVKGKTVSVALSREQFEWLAEAIAQWRTVQATLKE